MSAGVILAAVAGVLALAFVVVWVMNRSGGDSWEKRAGSKKPGGGRTGAQRVNWLVGRTGQVEGKTFHVGSRTATIGRGVGNFIQISDENASKVHAQLIGAPSGLRIKDMGSSNGTTVNGEPLEPDTPLRLNDGDEIVIGDTLFVYRRAGNFRDEALTGAKDVRAARQKKTQALGAVGGAGDLKSQIEQAVAEADGDYDKAAAKVGLDASMIRKIVGTEEEA